MKNILIVGSPRVGKTTLAKKIANELGYIYVGLDNVFESIEELNCWPYPKYSDAKVISHELSNFVINYINNLDKEYHYVIEGAYLDIETIFPKLKNVNVIGLTYNELDKNKLFNNIKKYDHNEWINKFNDSEILEKSNCFILRNNYYNKCFKKLNINSYDLSCDYHLVMKKIVNELKKEFINEDLEIVIDRPLGSKHPKHDIIYEVNYGYLPNTKSDDGEEIDCYLLGVDKKVDRFIGKCIGIVRRTNDDDDKLIIVPKGINLKDEEIEKQINFQEKYFEHILIR